MTKIFYSGRDVADAINRGNTTFCHMWGIGHPHGSEPNHLAVYAVSGGTFFQMGAAFPDQHTADSIALMLEQAYTSGRVSMQREIREVLGCEPVRHKS